MANAGNPQNVAQPVSADKGYGMPPADKGMPWRGRPVNPMPQADNGYGGPQGLPIRPPADNGYSMPQFPQTGLLGSEQALQGGLQGALGMIGQGANVAGGFQQPYAQQGGNAFNMQSNLAGANGMPAQQQAFDNYQSSPEQAYLRQQGEQALMRNNAAMGGLGGGNVRKELMQQGIGMAAQDYGNSFNRLGQLSSMGQQAANNQSQIATGASQYGAGAMMNTGQNLAQGRTNAGNQIANAAGTAGSALGNLINQQGQNASSIIGQGTGNLANILSGAGQAQYGSQSGLATLLANIASGAGSTSAGLPGVPGVNADSTLSNWGDALSGAANLYSKF